MPRIIVETQGDGCWSDLAATQQEGKLIDMMGENAPPIRIALLPGGMKSGRASVTLRLELPDGRIILTESSLCLFVQAINLMTIVLDEVNDKAGHPSITCPRCGFTSHHPEDIKTRYCGNCHLFNWKGRGVGDEEPTPR